MISYEELCQALDLHNNRQKNAAEMAGLDRNEESGDFEQMKPGFLMADELAASPGAMRNIPTAVDNLDEGATPSAPLNASEEIPGSEMQIQPSEDTHEIDVDDVEIEDK